MQLTNKLTNWVGKLFTRRARFEKIVEAAGRTLIGKQGKDLSFWRSRSTLECDLPNIRFSPCFLVFYSNFAPLRLIFLKITVIHDL